MSDKSGQDHTQELLHLTKAYSDWLSQQKAWLRDTQFTYYDQPNRVEKSALHILKISDFITYYNDLKSTKNKLTLTSPHSVFDPKNSDPDFEFKFKFPTEATWVLQLNYADLAPKYNPVFTTQYNLSLPIGCIFDPQTKHAFPMADQFPLLDTEKEIAADYNESRPHPHLREYEHNIFTSAIALADQFFTTHEFPDCALGAKDFLRGMAYKLAMISTSEAYLVELFQEEALWIAQGHKKAEVARGKDAQNPSEKEIHEIAIRLANTLRKSIFPYFMKATFADFFKQLHSYEQELLKNIPKNTIKSFCKQAVKLANGGKGNIENSSAYLIPPYYSFMDLFEVFYKQTFKEVPVNPEHAPADPMRCLTGRFIPSTNIGNKKNPVPALVIELREPAQGQQQYEDVQNLCASFRTIHQTILNAFYPVKIQSNAALDALYYKENDTKKVNTSILPTKAQTQSSKKQEGVIIIEERPAVSTRSKRKAEQSLGLSLSTQNFFTQEKTKPEDLIIKEAKPELPIVENYKNELIQSIRTHRNQVNFIADIMRKELKAGYFNVRIDPKYFGNYTNIHIGLLSLELNESVPEIFEILNNQNSKNYIDEIKNNLSNKSAEIEKARAQNAEKLRVVNEAIQTKLSKKLTVTEHTGLERACVFVEEGKSTIIFLLNDPISTIYNKLTGNESKDFLEEVIKLYKNALEKKTPTEEAPRKIKKAANNNTSVLNNKSDSDLWAQQHNNVQNAIREKLSQQDIILIENSLNTVTVKMHDHQFFILGNISTIFAILEGSERNNYLEKVQRTYDKTLKEKKKVEHEVSLFMQLLQKELAQDIILDYQIKHGSLSNYDVTISDSRSKTSIHIGSYFDSLLTKDIDKVITEIKYVYELKYFRTLLEKAFEFKGIHFFDNDFSVTITDELYGGTIKISEKHFSHLRPEGFNVIVSKIKELYDPIKHLAEIIKNKTGFKVNLNVTETGEIQVMFVSSNDSFFIKNNLEDIIANTKSQDAENYIISLIPPKFQKKIISTQQNEQIISAQQNEQAIPTQRNQQFISIQNQTFFNNQSSNKRQKITNNSNVQIQKNL